MRKHSGLIDYQFLLLLLLSALVLPGCGGDEIFEPASTDSGTDAGNDVSTDAGSDAGTDAGIGTSTDAETDVSTTDTGTDSGTDAGIGASTDAETDAGTTAASDDAMTIAGSDSGMNTEGDAGTDVGANTGTDTETGGEIIFTPTIPATIGDANCAPFRASGGSVSIAGLYDISEDFEFEQVNRAFLDIADNGAGTVYSYLQDDFNQGGNCYSVSPGWFVFSPVVDDLYIFTSYEDADENCEIRNLQTTIVRSDTQLRFISSDTDENGATTETTIITWPVVSGISTESFNRCE